MLGWGCPEERLGGRLFVVEAFEYKRFEVVVVVVVVVVEGMMDAAAEGRVVAESFVAAVTEQVVAESMEGKLPAAAVPADDD